MTFTHVIHSQAHNIRGQVEYRKGSGLRGLWHCKGFFGLTLRPLPCAVASTWLKQEFGRTGPRPYPLPLCRVFPTLAHRLIHRLDGRNTCMKNQFMNR
jgi:hypothetical protein